MTIYVSGGRSAWGYYLKGLASLTPGINTKPVGYTTVMGPLTTNCYKIVVKFWNGSVAVQARDMIVDVAYSLDAGVTWTMLLPNQLASCASSVAAGLLSGCITYVYPVFMPANAIIGARASINNATVGTVLIEVQVWGSPENGDSIKYGRIVRAYGIVPATSCGTAFAPGVLDIKGAYTQLGTVAANDTIFWWQMGLGTNDTTMQTQRYLMDLAVGSAAGKFICINDQWFLTTTSESIANNQNSAEVEHLTPPGTGVYIRGSTSVVAQDTNVNGAAYGVVV